jgi:hypothetical protein
MVGHEVMEALGSHGVLDNVICGGSSRSRSSCAACGMVPLAVATTMAAAWEAMVGHARPVCCPVATAVQGADPSPASVLNRAAFDDGIGVLDQLKMATKIIAIVHMLQLIVLIFENRFLSCCKLLMIRL